MSTTKVWSIEVFLTEDAASTRAEARLEVGDRKLSGWGYARRNPADPDVPVIGEELATVRALTHLSHELLQAAAGDIEDLEGQPVSVPS